jgi:hypothetical protein
VKVPVGISRGFPLSGEGRPDNLDSSERVFQIDPKLMDRVRTAYYEAICIGGIRQFLTGSFRVWVGLPVMTVPFTVKLRCGFTREKPGLTVWEPDFLVLG